MVTPNFDALKHALDCVLCFCGNHKRMGKPLCFQCFDCLPREWQIIMTRTLKQCNHPELSPELAKQYTAAKRWIVDERRLCNALATG